MTDTPTLEKVLADRPDQLPPLTPVEIDRMNAVLFTELDRIGDEGDKAADGIHRALLQHKESKRRGRGYTQVWPMTLDEAERIAREHLASGYTPDQMTRLREGLTGRDAYATQLRAAVARLDDLRARSRIVMDAVTTLDGEFCRRGGWSRMHLCLSDGGHLHTGRQCPSIGPSTRLLWLPEVSGMPWREAFEVLPKTLSGGSPAIMCTKCYPDAPTEWTKKPDDPNRCPGTGQYAKLMEPRMGNRLYRWAECHVCHDPKVTVTPNGNLRKHKPMQSPAE